jgi:catechol 2,3-dioxygenase-like lactoylglutathione lyase family enzyme
MVALRVLFVATFAVVSPAPAEERALFGDALGLPLRGESDYVYTDEVEGAKHFGIWPLSETAQACFGSPEWPSDRPVPQASIEFDVDDVEAAAEELRAQGYELLHGPRIEPWGQTVARLQSPSGVIVGVTFTPPMRDGT